MDEDRYTGLHVEKRVELYPALFPSEPRPPEDRKTKVDRCGIEGVDLAFDGFRDSIGHRYQAIGEVPENPMVAPLVRLGKVASGDPFAESQMVGLLFVRPKAGDQVAKAVPIGKLSEDHAEELVPASEMPDVPIAAVLLYDTVE